MRGRDAPLLEHEHHVRLTRVTDAGRSWCGVRHLGWCFIDVDHVAIHRLNGGRLLPCPACLQAIVDALVSQ